MDSAREDAILSSVRNQISEIFGHSLSSGTVTVNATTGRVHDDFQSPGSSNSPPHTIAQSVMPLLALSQTIPSSTDEIRKLSPHHLLSSPPPDARRSLSRASLRDNDVSATTVYISPSSSMPPPVPQAPTSRTLGFAPSEDIQRVAPPSVNRIHIDRNGRVSVNNTNINQSNSNNNNNNYASSRLRSPPNNSNLDTPIGPHHSHQPNAAPTTSGSLMGHLFSSKLVPYTRSPTLTSSSTSLSLSTSSPTSTSPRTRSAVLEGDNTSPIDPPTSPHDIVNGVYAPSFAGLSSSFNTTNAHSIVTNDLHERLKHCSAYLGHRSEKERYASLLTMQSIVVQHMSTLEPNSPTPLGLLPETTLHACIVMLEQSPMGLSGTGGRCHEICLSILKWYGESISPIVPRLASLLRRLWMVRERLSGGNGDSIDNNNNDNGMKARLWLHVKPTWIIDVLVCTGLNGIDVLLHLCEDGYGKKDASVLHSIVQHPSMQRALVAVALSDDLSHPDVKRAEAAVKCLHVLGPVASTALKDMSVLLECTSILPEIVCNAMASCTTIYDRTGENQLSQLLVRSRRPDVRKAASDALGELFGQENTTLIGGRRRKRKKKEKKTNKNFNPISIQPPCVMVAERMCSSQTMFDVTNVQPVTLEEKDGTSMLYVDGRHLLTSLQSVRSDRRRGYVSWFSSWNGTTKGYLYAASGASTSSMGLDTDGTLETSENSSNVVSKYTMSLETLRALDTGLSDADGSVRASAVLSLASAFTEQPLSLTMGGTLKRMISLTEDTDEIVRSAAAEAIGWLGSKLLEMDIRPSMVHLLSNGSRTTTPQRKRYGSGNTNRTTNGTGGSNTGGTSNSRGGGFGFTPGSTRFSRSRRATANNSTAKSTGRNSTLKNQHLKNQKQNQNNENLHSVLQRLQILLSDRYRRVRHSASIAIGRLGPGANALAMDVLHALDGGKVQRIAAARSLVQLVPVGQQILLDLLCNARCHTRGGEKTRVAACVGLASLPPNSELLDAVVRVLFDTCKDPTPDVRSAALSSLGILSCRSDINNNNNNSNNINSDTSHQHQYSSTYLSSRSLLPFVYSHLRDNDVIVRTTAAEVLAKSVPQGEMLLIEGLLQDRDEKVRVAITQGLKVVGSRTIRTLFLAMRDKSIQVREAAANVVIDFGVDNIVLVLAKRANTARTAVVHELKSLLQSDVTFPDGTSQMLLALIGRLSGFTVLRRDL